MCESTGDILASSAANQGDNTVSVAQGGTATPGATEHIYIYVYIQPCIHIYIYIYIQPYMYIYKLIYIYIYICI